MRKTMSLRVLISTIKTSGGFLPLKELQEMCPNIKEEIKLKYWLRRKYIRDEVVLVTDQNGVSGLVNYSRYTESLKSDTPLIPYFNAKPQVARTAPSSLIDSLMVRNNGIVPYKVFEKEFAAAFPSSAYRVAAACQQCVKRLLKKGIIIHKYGYIAWKEKEQELNKLAPVKSTAVKKVIPAATPPVDAPPEKIRNALYISKSIKEIHFMLTQLCTSLGLDISSIKSE